MPYVVTIDHDNLPDGGEVFIHGLGTFANRVPKEVSDRQADAFSKMNSTVEFVYDENGDMRPEGKLGPTIEEAAETIRGVTVEYIKASLTPPSTPSGSTPTPTAESGTDAGSETNEEVGE